MRNRELSMIDATEVLRRWQAGHSARQMAREGVDGRRQPGVRTTSPVLSVCAFRVALWRLAWTANLETLVSDRLYTTLARPTVAVTEAERAASPEDTGRLRAAVFSRNRVQTSCDPVRGWWTDEDAISSQGIDRKVHRTLHEDHIRATFIRDRVADVHARRDTGGAAAAACCCRHASVCVCVAKHALCPRNRHSITRRLAAGVSARRGCAATSGTQDADAGVLIAAVEQQAKCERGELPTKAHCLAASFNFFTRSL